jgi:hypothetical protein
MFDVQRREERTASGERIGIRTSAYSPVRPHKATIIQARLSRTYLSVATFYLVIGEDALISAIGSSRNKSHAIHTKNIHPMYPHWRHPASVISTVAR